MKHIDEIELMEYLAGNLAASRYDEVTAHLAMCEECAERRREATEMWEALGQWDVDTTDHDVAARVAALAEDAGYEQRRSEKTHILRVRFLPAVLRVAASVIIAIGLGHKLGEYSVEGRKPQTASSSEKPEYLAAFGLEWSSDLAWLILEDDSSNTGEKQ